MAQIKRVAILTSGGDAPGMNAAIRAVVRAALHYKLKVSGVNNGYDGLIKGNFKKMNNKSVANIIHRGGTILKSARSEEFKSSEGRKKAYDQLLKNEVDAVVVIGGDGSFTGASIFSKEFNFPIIGIPGTIDNDLYGTDTTIGYDTATNTAVHAIDMIRDTAISHDRLFFVEVMGRDSGYIAMRSGIAGGATATLIPEEKMSIDDLVKILNKGAKRKKSSSLVIVAEGGKSGSATQIAEEVKKRSNYFETKVTILGHIQRGGAPSVYDRVLASRLGVAAIEGLIEGYRNEMVGLVSKKIKFTSLEKAIKTEKRIDKEAWRIAKILSS